MKKDPRVRRDGRCYVCRKPRNIAAMTRFAGPDGASDPFCSTACCKKWHGVVDAPYTPPLQVMRGGETGLERLRREVAEARRERILEGARLYPARHK